MKKRWRFALTLLAAVLFLTSGCSSNKPDPKYDFITFFHDSPQLDKNLMVVGEMKGYMKVGDNRTLIESVVGTVDSLHTGIWAKYEKAADGVRGDDTVISMMTDQTNKTTMYGTSLNSNYADLIPAYAKDKDVTVELDTKTKVVFSKVIDGVKYTVTYRNYANSGDVKTITITDTEKYTESDGDYPQYKTN